MSMLIQLAIYAALIAGAGIAFHVFENTYYVKPAEIRGAANQLAKDQTVLEQVKNERDAALTNAATNKTNFEGCDAKLKGQSDATARIAKDAAASRAAAHAAAQARQADDAQARATIETLKAQAAAPGVPGQTCQALLEKIDAVERAGARERRAVK